MVPKVFQVSSTRIADYASIPIAFEVREILAVSTPQDGVGGIVLTPQPVTPYIKDYDALEPPSAWLTAFDTSSWAFFLAQEGRRPLGGAIVAWNTNGVNMLEGRSDLSVLWDIRVRPEVRGQGIGKRLIAHAAAWSRARSCIQMKIETQNVNLNACRFYAACGARLGDIRRFAYRHEPAVAHEVQLNWYLEL